MFDFSGLHDAVLNTFGTGTDGPTVIHVPTSGLEYQIASAIPMNGNEISGQGEAVAPGNVLYLWFRASDFTTAPVRGNTIKYGGVSYTIEKVAPDATGSGGVVIHLRKK